jgi:adenine phosphoribosyltransferase
VSQDRGVTSGESLRDQLMARFAWRSDRMDDSRWADLTGWWRDADVLSGLGPALGDSFRSASPTVVLAPQARGYLLGVLVALSLGVGFVEVQKDAVPLADSDAWWQRTTPPDYRDRHLTLGLPRRHLQGGDRVVFVDDWIETGGQALGTQALVEDAGATWLGAAVVVDGLTDHRVRRQLDVRPLLHYRDLRPL